MDLPFSLLRFHRIMAVGICTTVLSYVAPGQAGMISVRGDTLHFAGPSSYQQDELLSFTLALGYGTVETTIGQGHWLSAPGVSDLSLDAGLPGFVAHATNGIEEPLFVTMTDQLGQESRFYFSGGGTEFMFLGGSPDLQDYALTRAAIHVHDLYVQPDGTGVISVQWEFLATPEPLSLLQGAVVVVCLVTLRARGALAGWEG